MIDDFVLYTMINNLCIDNKVSMHYNLRKEFKHFVKNESKPSHAMVINEDEHEKENGGA